MISFIIDHLIAYNVTQQHIFVEADSWYGTKKIRKFLNNLGVHYRLDGKKSYSVQMPDFEAIKQSQVVRRGRRRQQFVKYVKISKYFGPRETWNSFLDLESGSRIYFKMEQLNLKKGGQSLVYAFWMKNIKTLNLFLQMLKGLKNQALKLFITNIT